MSSKPTVNNRHGSAVITLPSDTEILITRAFDAPAELVFKAFTTPELVQRWWGFETSEWLVCEIDLRVGGQWRYVIRERDMEVGFHGEYREIDGPHRLVSTEVYEGFPDAGSLNIMTLDEVDGVTTMTHARPARDAGAPRHAAGLGHGERHAGLLRPHGGPRPPARLSGRPRRPGGPPASRHAPDQNAAPTRPAGEVLPEEARLCSHRQDFVGGGGAAARWDPSELMGPETYCLAGDRA